MDACRQLFWVTWNWREDVVWMARQRGTALREAGNDHGGALPADVTAALEPRLTDRFLPFVVMREFEAPLFNDCERFGDGIGRPDLVPSFPAIRDWFTTPRAINGSATTAPSKRVEKLVPGCEKPSRCTLAVPTIGLDAIRRECPDFGACPALLEARAA